MKSIDLYRGSLTEKNIKKIKLSNEHYFLSLVTSAMKCGIIDEDKAVSIQVQMLSLLEKEIERYTLGESSSVRVEIAEKVLLSIQYVIGLYLKSCESVESCIGAINNSGLEEIYKKGKEKLALLFDESRAKYDYVMEHKIKTNNYAYNDTLDLGIPPFFIEYDKKFAAHDTPGSIDYPLYQPEIDLIGVEYITEYLRRIEIENFICSKFDEDEIIELLKNYDKHSDELLINILSIVLFNALGSVIVGKEADNLILSYNDIADIKYKLNKEGIEHVLKNALAKVLLQLGINESKHSEYILNDFNEMIIRTEAALEIDKLNRVFIERVEQAEEEKIAFIDKDKMDDEEFRKVVELIKEAKEVKEKILLINEKINSLEDLIDVFDSDSIFDDEFTEVLMSISDEEIALIIKYINLAEDYGMDDEGRRPWHKILKEYVGTLSEERKAKIANIIERLV